MYLRSTSGGRTRGSGFAAVSLAGVTQTFLTEESAGEVRWTQSARVHIEKIHCKKKKKKKTANRRLKCVEAR